EHRAARRVGAQHPGDRRCPPQSEHEARADPRQPVRRCERYDLGRVRPTLPGARLQGRNDGRGHRSHHGVPAGGRDLRGRRRPYRLRPTGTTSRRRGDVGGFGGVIGTGTAEGIDALNTYFPLAEFRRNVMAGGNASIYPADNFSPVSLDDAGFVNRGAGDYRLDSSSPYHNAATDGSDVGANITALDASTAGAISGVPPAGSD